MVLRENKQIFAAALIGVNHLWLMGKNPGMTIVKLKMIFSS